MKNACGFLILILIIKFKQKIEKILGSRISKFLRPAQRNNYFKLILIPCQAACHGKTEHGIFVKFENLAKLLLSSRICCSSAVFLGYSVPSAHHFTIWCRSTFGPRGPGLSNPTSFLRPIQLLINSPLFYYN